MDSNASIQLTRVLEGLEAQIKRLESSSNRPFVLIEYHTLDLFHYFNLHFKRFWVEFDRHSATQLFQFYKIYNSHSELSKRYEKLFREQIGYLGRVINVKDKRGIGMSPVVFSEVKSKDVISFYEKYCKELKDDDGKPFYDISLDRDYYSEEIDGKDVPVDIYKFHSDTINRIHYEGLYGMSRSLGYFLELVYAVCAYPNHLINGYDLDKEDIIRALDNGLRQYAKEIGKKVERDLRRTAQFRKSSRHAQLTPDVWGLVMDEEDDLYRLAISGQLEENEEKRFENIFEEQRKQLIDNASLLQKIMSTAIDGELFDIRLSVETHNLLTSLNADNLDLFYELVLRRNIIQREMYPDELSAKYEEWINPSEEHLEEREVPVSNGKSGNNNQHKVNITTPCIVLQQLLQQDWFEAICTDKKQYSKGWRDELVSNLMASEHGMYVARLWEHQEKIPTIKAKFIGTLILAGVLKDNKLAASREFLGIDKNTRDKDEKKEASTFANYMGQCKSEPYVEWIQDYVTRSKEKA